MDDAEPTEPAAADVPSSKPPKRRKTRGLVIAIGYSAVTVAYAFIALFSASDRNVHLVVVGAFLVVSVIAWVMWLRGSELFRRRPLPADPNDLQHPRLPDDRR